MERWILGATLGVIAGIVITIFFLYRVLVKKTLFLKHEEKKYKPITIKVFNIIYSIIIIIFLVPFYIYGMIPYFLDIKYIISGEYLIFEGEVINADDSNIILQNDIGESIEIELISGQLAKSGNSIRVRYLPNLEIGEKLY